MPIKILNCKFGLTREEVAVLWNLAREAGNMDDGEVVINCVDRQEIKRLNKLYRKSDQATNVLTFSYGDGKHDIALCCEVAEKEARERGADIKRYLAWVMVHAFLHAAGMDHERGDEEKLAMERTEKDILKKAGWVR